MAKGDLALEIKQEPQPPYGNENATGVNNGEIATESNNGENPSQSNEVQSTKGKWIEYALFAICSIVFIPFFLLYAGAMWLFCNIDVTELEELSKHDADKQGKKTVFQMVQEVQEKTKNLGKLPNVIQSRLVIFVFSWLIVNFSVRKLRNRLVLGTKLWKWTLLVTIILCGYHLISMLTKFLIYTLCLNPRFKKKKSWVYYVRGIRQSINLVAQAALILLTWVSYFRTSHGIKKNKDTHTFLHVCTWSFVTFAVMAVLWLLKSVLLLKWKADAVYRRFSQRILVAGEQVYFLGYICGWRLGIFKPMSEEEKEQMILEGADIDTEPTSESVGTQPKTVGEVEKTKSVKIKEEENRIEEKKKAKRILLRDKNNVTLYDIQKMTEYFVDLFKISSRVDDCTFEIKSQCKKINGKTDSNKAIEVEDLVKFFQFEEGDAKTLLENLRHTLNSGTISHRDFEKSMVRAQNNCVALGHTLMDAGEVVGVLNNVMVVLLFSIVFIAWLLLTDIATTKILVLIASPLLAVTFIFGDTCKKIFEGIIFSFINHPFDVGDRCIIGNTEVEVRRMSVLTTTFVGIETKEEVLYPNSALAAVPITNLKGEPDPSDCIELTLDSSYTNSMIGVLDENIKDFFKNETSGKFEKKCSVVVKDIGGGVKMEVQFEHVMSINEITHSQCLKKKKEQKSYLYLHIKECMDKSEQENKELMDKMK